MAFENAKENRGTFTDEELQAEREKLLAEISMLGSKQDEARGEHENISNAVEEKKIQLQEIEKKIAEHQPIIDKHKEELASVRGEIARLDSVVTSNGELDKTVADKQAQIAAHQVTVDELKKQIADLKMQITQIENDIAEADSKHATDRDNQAEEIDQLTSHISGLGATRSKYEAQIATMENEVKVLEGVAKGHAENSRAALEELARLNDDIEFAKKELQQIYIDTKKQKDETNIEVEARLNSIAEKEEAITKREGVASVKESWIREKWERLRSIKDEVELHLGRKIPVIIPPQDAI